MPATKAGGVPAVFILYGRKAREDLFDEYLARRHIESIKSLLGDQRDITVSEYDTADAPDIADILDEVSTPALWGSKRLVILKGAQLILDPPVAARAGLEAVLDRIRALAAAKSPVGWLVLVAKALKVTRSGVQIGFKPAAPIVKEVEKRGGLLSCVPPFESAVKRELVARAAEAGRRLSRDAVDALVDRVGSDQAALHEELQKLLSVTEGSQTITARDVEEASAHRAQGDVFRLADAILDRDAPTAFVQLDDLASISSRGCAYLVFPLARSFERMLAAARLVGEGRRPREAAEAVGVPRFAQQAFAARLVKWDAAALEKLLERLLQIDVAMKSGGLKDRAALETFVSAACATELSPSQPVGRWIYEV
ncbi:MAG: DNA polymerase III subunit delta [Planctomycetota bacterium]